MAAVKLFLAKLLRELDPRAELVECEGAATGLGFMVRARVAGELTKPTHVPATMLTRAGDGDPFALYMVRAVLKTMLLGVTSRQAADRTTELKHHRRTRREP